MTNEDNRKSTQDLKDVAAGRQTPVTPGAGSPPGSTPDAGDGRTSIEDLSGAVAGSRTVASSSPANVPPSNDPNGSPGAGLGVEPLENLVAGAGRNQTTTGSGTPDATPDPGNDGPPQNIGGGTDISQIPNQTG